MTSSSTLDDVAPVNKVNHNDERADDAEADRQSNPNVFADVNTFAWVDTCQ
jgi:hypothetical protein